MRSPWRMRWPWPSPRSRPAGQMSWFWRAWKGSRSRPAGRRARAPVGWRSARVWLAPAPLAPDRLARRRGQARRQQQVRPPGESGRTPPPGWAPRASAAGLGSGEIRSGAGSVTGAGVGTVRVGGVASRGSVAGRARNECLVTPVPSGRAGRPGSAGLAGVTIRLRFGARFGFRRCGRCPARPPAGSAPAVAIPAVAGVLAVAPARAAVAPAAAAPIRGIGSVTGSRSGWPLALAAPAGGPDLALEPGPAGPPGSGAAAFAASTASCMRCNTEAGSTGRPDGAGATLAAPGTRRRNGRCSSSMRVPPCGAQKTETDAIPQLRAAQDQHVFKLKRRSSSLPAQISTQNRS
jgi:hypothetical protein